MPNSCCPPAWATYSERDDDAGGWLHFADLPAGAVTVELMHWEDDEDPGFDGTTVAIRGAVPSDPIGLLRIADALSRAAGVLT